MGIGRIAKRSPGVALITTILMSAGFGSASVQDESKELAKKLANPLATLISVPNQLNYDENIGPSDSGSLLQLYVQPVIPFPVSEDWLLISRTIVSVINQSDIPIQGEGESGLGDILQSFFFSPDEATKRGWIWGAGPAMLLPTASNDALGSEKWAVGPTAVALKQQGPWTYGILVNHLWSFAGEGGRDDINLSYVEPWLSFVTRSNTTISISAETNYDWKAEGWSVPVNLIADQLLQIGKQYVAIGGAIKYWAESLDSGPEDIGYRL